MSDLPSLPPPLYINHRETPSEDPRLHQREITETDGNRHIKKALVVTVAPGLNIQMFLKTPELSLHVFASELDLSYKDFLITLETNNLLLSAIVGAEVIHFLVPVNRSNSVFVSEGDKGA